MNNEKEIADREQVLEQAFAAAKNGNMALAQARIDAGYGCKPTPVTR